MNGKLVTKTRCSQCGNEGVKKHDYLTFSYWFCDNCKAEVQVSTYDVLEVEFSPPPLIDMGVIDFGDLSLPNGACNGSSGASDQSQLSTQTSDDQHSYHSQPILIDGIDVDSSQDWYVDGDIPAIDGCQGLPVCKPQDLLVDSNQLRPWMKK